MSHHFFIPWDGVKAGLAVRRVARMEFLTSFYYCD